MKYIQIKLTKDGNIVLPKKEFEEVDKNKKVSDAEFLRLVKKNMKKYKDDLKYLEDK